MSVFHAHGPAHLHPARPGGRSEHANRLLKRAAIASVTVAVVLIALKAWAASETGSVALFGSLTDSALDLIASLITLGGVRWAAAPADEDHRFGHGKAEALAAFLQVLIIAGSSVLIFNHAVERLLQPVVPAAPEFGIGVSLIAIVATLALMAVQTAAIRASASLAIETDRMHYASDLGLNLSVIAALMLESYAGVHGADPVFGVGIALYLLFGALRAGKTAIDMLMDREWPEPERQRLLTAASADPRVRGIHDLRTRGRGQHQFAQLHIWVDPAMTVQAAHDVVDAVEARVAAAFPGLELLVHIDPEGHFDRQPAPDRPG